MAVDLKCFHCLSKYVLKEPYFIKSHKVASRTDFIREVESVLMPQIYLGLHVRNTPKVSVKVIDCQGSFNHAPGNAQIIWE